MSWKRHVAAVPQGAKLRAAIERVNSNLDYQTIGGSNSKFSSYLPEVYAGPPNRIERYQQYDNMDRDPEVAAALDIIADFSTQTEEQDKLPFNIVIKGDATDAEIEILNTALDKWSMINDFKKRIWKIFRSSIMYGDQFFVRDPETFEWFWVNHEKVEKIIVNEADGKKTDQYIVQELDLNLQTLVATLPTKNPNRGIAGWAGTAKNSGPVASGFTTAPTVTQGRFGMGQSASVIDAEHVIHLSLSEGLDANWPFGNSVLESVFKPFKQKELLEDAVIIYRVQRAPERRVFYIDVGDAPPHKAMEFVNRIKNEIHQRRIPSLTGGGTTILDAAYNPLCLALDTRIPLLDGRTLPLNELIIEFEDGKENWVYSCDPITGKIVPGNISWAGVTKRDTEVIKLTLDNGEILVVTPEHKIPVLGKGFVEAQNLTEDDSLISFETKNKSLVSSDSGRTYTQIYDHEQNKWIYVHRMVGNFFRHLGKHQEFTYLNEGHKTVVHHNDFDRYNNTPENLKWMNYKDHIKYHQDQNFWAKAPAQEAERVKAKISNTLREKWLNATPEERAKGLRNIEAARKKAVWLRNNDPEVKERYKRNASISRKKFLSENPTFLEKVLLPNLSNYQVNCPNQEKVYTQKMLQRIVRVVKKYNSNRIKTAELLKYDKILLEEIKRVNPVKSPNFKIKTDEFTTTLLDKTIKHFGYIGWKDFKKKVSVYNHRVVKIEILTEKQDVGTITIDAQEIWHNYHTFAIESGIFVKNSIIEDYFFPQSSDGRGSRVETLPGGSQTDELDDLKYFNNKLLRGLRVPPSFLAFGYQDDSGTIGFTDGRVGTAFMQEFRFAKHCKRLQNLVNPVFDREFKIFLRHRGIQIDAALFEIQLHEPQNFSKYRQIEIDSAQIGVYQPLSEVKYLSKRFLMKRYLGMSDDEILENETMWREENPDTVKAAIPGDVGVAAGGGGLSAIGVRPEPEELDAGDIGDEIPEEGGEGIESPISGTEETEAGGEEEELTL